MLSCSPGWRSRVGSDFSGQQHVLTGGFNRPPAVKEAQFLSLDEYKFEKSAGNLYGSQSGNTASRTGSNLNYGNRSRSPRRGPQYGVEVLPHSEGFTRSIIKREDVDDGDVSVAQSQRTAMTTATRISKTTEPAHAFLEYTGASPPGGLVGGSRSALY